MFIQNLYAEAISPNGMAFGGMALRKQSDYARGFFIMNQYSTIITYISELALSLLFSM
jgi:hypothetical protein